MKKIFGIALLILFVGIMSACNNDTSEDEQATAPVTESTEEQDEAAVTDPAEDPNEAAVSEPSEEKTTALAGDEVFQKSCITCHSSGDITGGQGKIDGAQIQADFQSQEDLLTFVSEKMPKSAPGSLTPEEYEAVVKYLWEQ